MIRMTIIISRTVNARRRGRADERVGSGEWCWVFMVAASGRGVVLPLFLRERMRGGLGESGWEHQIIDRLAMLRHFSDVAGLLSSGHD